MQMTGTISLHPRGFGFLTNDERSAFVAPPELNRFLEGDLASAQVEESSPGKFSATGLELQRRWRHELFGTVVLRGKRTYLKVDRSVSNTDWPLSGGRGLKSGDTVIASLENEELVDPVLVEENSSLERCLVRHGIRRHFPDIKWNAPSDDLARTDLREIPTVTIDAPTTKDIDDADSQFTLSAGRHRLSGKEALGYVRVRKTLGDGSDLNRIKRQQAFLSSIAQEATSTKLLLRPDRLFSFLNAATKSLTTGDFEDVSVTWKNPPAGFHSIFVVADDPGQITESDETNNKQEDTTEKSQAWICCPYHNPAHACSGFTQPRKAIDRG